MCPVQPCTFCASCAPSNGLKQCELLVTMSQSKHARMNVSHAWVWRVILQQSTVNHSPAYAEADVSVIPAQQRSCQLNAPTCLPARQCSTSRPFAAGCCHRLLSQCCRLCVRHSTRGPLALAVTKSQHGGALPALMRPLTGTLPPAALYAAHLGGPRCWAPGSAAASTFQRGTPQQISCMLLQWQLAKNGNSGDAYLSARGVVRAAALCTSSYNRTHERFVSRQQKLHSIHRRLLGCPMGFRGVGQAARGSRLRGVWTNM
jgi:hypothetical protein